MRIDFDMWHTTWLKSASTVLRACCQLLQSGLVGAISLSSLRLWKTASSDCQSKSLFSPHASFPIQRLFSTGRAHESWCRWLRAVYLARATCPQVQWSEVARECAVFLSNFLVSFAIGLCTRVTLCYAHLDKGSLDRWRRQWVWPYQRFSNTRSWKQDCVRRLSILSSSSCFTPQRSRS